MKMIRTLIPALTLLVLLYGCAAGEKTLPTEIPPPSLAVTEPTQEREEPVQEETIPARESVQETEPASDTGATEPDPIGTGSQADSKEPDVTVPPKTEPAKPQNPPSAPPATQPPSVRPANPDPKPTDPPQKETQPPETQPPATQPPATEPPEVPPETIPPETEPDPNEPAVTEITYEFKRQVAASAAKYINQYRASAGLPKCTVLPVMTLVAEYRADQLCYDELPVGMELIADSENALLLNVEQGKYPFFEHRAVSVDLKQIAVEGMRVFSLTTVKEFQDQMPSLVTVLVLLLIPVILWVVTCFLSINVDKRKWLIVLNILLAVTSLALMRYVLSGIDLPAAMLPDGNILDWQHYSDEFTIIFDNLENMGIGR